jgi:hypothetical protein
MDNSIDINDRYIENTEEYERALSALSMPNGQRLSEIAESKYNSVPEETLRKVTRYLVEEHVLLLDSDGEKSDPRIYRNNVMSMFQMVWRVYTVRGPDGLNKRLDELYEEIDAYKKETGCDTPQELLDDIKDEDKDLSHIEIDNLYDVDSTGEIFWDVYSPWSNKLREIQNVKTTIKLSEEISESMSYIDMDVNGQYGDFSNINAVRSKLGLEEQPPDDSILNEDGTLKD